MKKKLSTLIFYKPFDVICQFSREEGETGRTLADFVTVPNVYPAGRLDRDSEGLLLLTDDGALQHRLTDPKFAHPRTYWVQVEGEVTEQALRQLSTGVDIQGKRTRPAVARALPQPEVPERTPPIRYRKSIPSSWLELTLREGRNRQVRRMTAAVGFPTLRLIRNALGELTVEGLQPGEWRVLTPRELAGLRSPGEAVDSALHTRAAGRRYTRGFRR